jgi:hypothetical protein
MLHDCTCLRRLEKSNPQKQKAARRVQGWRERRGFVKGDIASGFQKDKVLRW